MSESTDSVGFIGLGSMGLPMARNLIDAGFKLSVFNRTKSKADELVTQGAKVVDTPAAVASENGMIVTMVANDTVLREIVTGSDGIGNKLGQGGIHLSMSTVSPQIARELAEFHSQRGAAYVASPVLGRPDAAATKQLLMWVSGAKEAKERIAPLIAAMGRGSFDVGEDAVLGHVAKIATNVLLMNTVEILSEVFTFTEKNGLDAQLFADAMIGSLFASPIFKTYGNLLVSGELPDPGFKLALALKDINLALTTGEAADVTMPLVSVLRDQLLTSIAKGRGELDVTALQQNVREDAGLPAIRHP